MVEHSTIEPGKLLLFLLEDGRRPRPLKLLRKPHKVHLIDKRNPDLKLQPLDTGTLLFPFDLEIRIPHQFRIDNRIIAILRPFSNKKLIIPIPLSVLDERLFEDDEDSVFEEDLRGGEADETVVGGGVFESGDCFFEGLGVETGLGLDFLLQQAGEALCAELGDLADQVLAD